MKEQSDKRSVRSSTVEVLERMIALAEPLGLEMQSISVSALSLHLEGHNIKQVASLLGIKYNAANEIIWRGLYELKRIQEGFANFVNENKRLKEENARITEENQAMRQAIGSKEADVIISNYFLEKEMTADNRPVDKELLKKLSTSVFQLGLSTRTTLALVAGSKYTLGDIVKCKRSDILQYRTIGLKRISEIDKVIEEAGLTYEYKF